MNSFQQGNQKVLLELYFEKEQKWFSCGCFLVESTYSKEILGIMLIRDITENKDREKRTTVTTRIYTY